MRERGRNVNPRSRTTDYWGEARRGGTDARSCVERIRHMRAAQHRRRRRRCYYHHHHHYYHRCHHRRRRRTSDGSNTHMWRRGMCELNAESERFRHKLNGTRQVWRICNSRNSEACKLVPFYFYMRNDVFFKEKNFFKYKRRLFLINYIRNCLEICIIAYLTMSYLQIYIALCTLFVYNIRAMYNLFFYYDNIIRRTNEQFYSDVMIYVYANSSPSDSTTIFAAPVYLYCCRSISPVQDTHPCRRKCSLGEKELNSPRSYDVSMADLHAVAYTWCYVASRTHSW